MQGEIDPVGSGDNSGTITPPCAWQALSPMVSAALDDPDRGILILDPQLRLVHATDTVSKLLGIAQEPVWTDLDLTGLLSRTDLDPISSVTAEAAILQAREYKTGEPVRLFSINSSREIRMSVRNIGQRHVVTTFISVSGTVPQSTDHGESALRDELTGLCTRRDFEKAVSLAAAQSADVAFFMIDLDRFKPVNDSLGHAAGDKVLRLVAQRLKSVVKHCDLVARLGGDEFALLIRLSPAADPEAIARRIVDLIGRTYLVNGHLVNVGVSIGIAVAPRNGSKYDVLARCADLALYHSKSSGRGTFHFFTEDMEKRAQAKRTSELDLRRAVGLRQLEVHYQPQIDIETQTLIGFEALVRWRHPQRGLIPPNDFLPLAEEIGVIIQIGDWVLKTACHEAMKWPDHVVIAVNASPVQFETGRFAETVRIALAGTKLPARRLEIEVTEGILLREEEAVLATLQSLRAMGVRIAMDDFGTGHASLGQLARFNFDKIKIDQSLIGPDGGNAKHRAIVRAISALGSSLGMSTTAEGVETLDQLERMRLDGCGSVQGYLFSRPVPAEELKLLMEHLVPKDVRPGSLAAEKERKNQHELAALSTCLL